MTRSRQYLLALLGAVVAGVLLFLASQLLFESRAEAHSIGSDSVSPQEVIAWTSSSKYRSELLQADSDWEELDCRWGSSCRGVVIRSAGGGYSANLRVYDYSNCSSNINGSWRNAPNTDTISLNACRLDRKSYASRRGVVAHEMGHALGFAHPPCTEHYKVNSVLVTSSCGRRYIEPRPHDDSDYYNKWVR